MTKKLKDRLLRESDLTLDKCVKMFKDNELAEIQLKFVYGDARTESVKMHKNNFTGKSSQSSKWFLVRKELDEKGK